MNLTKSVSTGSASSSGQRMTVEPGKRLSMSVLEPSSSSSASSSMPGSKDQQSTATNNSSDDIYYNIVPTESDDFSLAESNYTDDTFFNPAAGLYPTSQDQVYDIIVKDVAGGGAGQQHHQHHHPQQHHHHHQPQQQPLRRDFVMREILNTEENFVAGLNTLMQDFLVPLSRVLKEQDRKCICINLDRLIELHTRLRNALSQACKGGPGRTQRICLVFEAFKVRIASFFINIFALLMFNNKSDCFFAPIFQ